MPTLEEFVREAVEKTGLDLITSYEQFRTADTYEGRCAGFAAHILNSWLLSRQIRVNQNPYPMTDIVELAEMILERKIDG